MDDQELIFNLLSAAARITRGLDRSLSAIKGISFSEYQLLSAIQTQPGGCSTRVDLAEAVGLTPSGVTRALKPLEKLGFVETIKDGRDARRSLASMTPAGAELTADAAGVVADVLGKVTAITEISAGGRAQLETAIQKIAHG